MSSKEDTFIYGLNPQFIWLDYVFILRTLNRFIKKIKNGRYLFAVELPGIIKMHTSIVLADYQIFRNKL
ncbi:hypothetical protein JCM15579A_18980 [Marinifilum fragile]